MDAGPLFTQETSSAERLGRERSRRFPPHPSPRSPARIVQPWGRFFYFHFFAGHRFPASSASGRDAPVTRALHGRQREGDLILASSAQRTFEPPEWRGWVSASVAGKAAARKCVGPPCLQQKKPPRATTSHALLLDGSRRPCLGDG